MCDEGQHSCVERDVKGHGDSGRSFAEAFDMTLDLFDFGVKMMRQNLKRTYPTDSDEEIDDRLSATRSAIASTWRRAPTRNRELD